MGLWRAIVGGPVDYELQDRGSRDVHGSAEPNDFESLKSLKAFAQHYADTLVCPSCGNRRVTGSGLIIEYGRIQLYRQVSYKGWLGGTKYRDELYKTVWRIENIGLYVAEGRALLNFFGALSPQPGQLKCNVKGCNWSINGGRGGAITLGQLLKLQ